MKTKIIIILFCVISSLKTVAQQNLVYNGDFEKYWYCPPIVANDSFPCKGWYSPDYGTPDYYNSCSKILEFSTPCNLAGCYKPHGGNAYIGILLISIETADMEHIQGRLTQPLKSGHKYQVSFWTRLAYQSSDYAAYNIGAILSQKKILTGQSWENKGNYISSFNPNLKAQVQDSNNRFIKDTTWVEVSGVYTAKGGEQYITIGMFWDDNYKMISEWEKNRQIDSTGGTISKSLKKCIEGNLLKKNPLMQKKYKNASFKLNQHFPYYLIDDVSVIEINE